MAEKSEAKRLAENLLWTTGGALAVIALIVATGVKPPEGGVSMPTGSGDRPAPTEPNRANPDSAQPVLSEQNNLDVIQNCRQEGQTATFDGATGQFIIQYAGDAQGPMYGLEKYPDLQSAEESCAPGFVPTLGGTATPTQ